MAVEREGRHRYYRLASEAVATVIEDLAHLAKLPLVLTQPRLSPAAQALRQARSCYNHLAGELAVAIALALEERGYLRRGEGKRYDLGGEGARRWFVAQGIDFQTLRPGRHGLARQCLDWTERRPHLAGPLGASLFRCWCKQGWLAQSKKHPRLVKTTPLGRRKLRQQLGLETTFSRAENP